MMLNEGLRVEPAPTCGLCGTSGDILYRDLRDRLFDAPGIWNCRRCPTCGLLWLDPRPVPADIGRLYRNYYTHADAPPRLASVRSFLKNSVLANGFGYDELRDGWLQRLFGTAISALPPVRDRVGMGIDYLAASRRGRILDVGCGSGLFLARMKQLGWDVQGVDPDPAAAKIAGESYGIAVAAGELRDARLAAESFDAVTLNHVIEHATDPVALVRECGRLLKPNGRLVIVTPNVESLGHGAQGVSWLALEPPRHLFLFSTSTLRACVERAGLAIELARSSARSAASVWTTSHQISRTGRGSLDVDASLRFHPRSLLFQCREEVACARGALVGEELLVIATRRP